MYQIQRRVEFCNSAPSTSNFTLFVEAVARTMPLMSAAGDGYTLFTGKSPLMVVFVEIIINYCVCQKIAFQQIASYNEALELIHELQSVKKTKQTVSIRHRCGTMLSECNLNRGCRNSVQYHNMSQNETIREYFTGALENCCKAISIITIQP